MIDLPVYDRSGKEVETLTVDESLLGSKIRHALLKQALVMYHANKRVGTAATKNRALVAGSTRKLYKQKGTGNARMGTVRTNVRKGGGVAHRKYARDFSLDMPKKQRRLAAASALLAKLQSKDVVVVNDLNLDAPKTRNFTAILSNLKIDRTCLVMTKAFDDMVWRSARNVARVTVQPVAQMNAADVCRHFKVLFTKEAIQSLLEKNQAEMNG